VLGYRPNCRRQFEARRAGLPIPAPCGQCPQELFHAATEWDVLYGGASYGGKTKALLMEGVKACRRHPGLAALAIRENYTELRESFLAELERVDYCKALGAVYNKSEHDLRFPGRSVLRFRYCDGLRDAKLRLGSEIQLLLVDEATMQQPEALDFLASRLRSSDERIPVLGVRLASNPGGPGHGAIKARYIDGTDHGRRVYPDVVDGTDTGHLVRFIPAKSTDNPHGTGVEQTLSAIKDPQMRAAYRDGSWDVFPGMAFPEWRRDLHVVAPFELPGSWRREAGVDYGYAAPWCTLWGALDGDGRVWIYRELYGSGVGEREQAERIHKTEAGDGKVRVRHGDPSMWAKVGDAHPVAVSYQMAGVALVKAENERVNGKGRVHTYLAMGAACPIHRRQGLEVCPLVHVLDGRAPNLVRTLPTLPTDPKDPEDVDTRAEDHAYDALRYLLMGFPVPKVVRPRSEPTVEDRIWASLERRRRNRHHPELGRI